MRPVVADVNDLKRSAILGTSRGIDAKKIAQIVDRQSIW